MGLSGLISSLFIFYALATQQFCETTSDLNVDYISRDTLETWPLNKDVGCPETWKALGDKCYSIDKFSRPYSNAESYCQSLGGYLVSIHSQLEQDFLTAYLGDTNPKGNVWIGLKKRGGSRTYTSLRWDEWNDGTKTNYTNYAPGEPSSISLEKCFHLEHADSVAGKWNDHRCDAVKGAICQVSRSKDKSQPKSFYLGKNNCGQGWESYRDRCYRFITQAKTWKNAEGECQSYGSHLVSISDSYEEAYLSFIIADKDFRSRDDKGIWIGLSNTNTKSRGRLTWSDASLIYHTNWRNDVKERSSIDTHCTAKSENSLWRTENCSVALPFICAKDLSPKNKSQTLFHGNCPPEWMDFGNQYCYYIETVDKEDFTDAVTECSRKGPNAILAEFHTESDLRLVLNYLKTLEVDSYYLGIKAKAFNFHYLSDDSIPTYLPWGEEEPNFVLTDKCVEVEVRRYSYNNLRCRDARKYICQISKEIIEEIQIHGHIPINVHKKSTMEHHKSKETTKAGGATTAVMVVIATIVIVAAVATILYRLHRKNPQREGGERVRFHNQE